MKRTRIHSKTLASLLCLCLFALAGNAKTGNATLPGTQEKKLQDAALRFTENRGQVTDVTGKSRPDILFTAHNGGTSIYLTATGIHYQFNHVIYPEGYIQDERQVKDETLQEKLREKVTMETYHFSMELAGANAQPGIHKEGKNKYTENFYLPQCPDGITDVATYQKIVYTDVYPNIDWVVYSNGERMKYDFIVHPGGKPEQIKLRVKDAQDISVTAAGELLMQTKLGDVREQAPVSYANGKKVDTRFVKNSDGSIGFAVAAIPVNTTLIIDPSVTWATYFGGSATETAPIGSILAVGIKCTTDASGNIYLAGSTQSTGIASGGYQTTLGGSTDAYIAKFDATGTVLWCTYYGGTSVDEFFGATDAGGHIYGYGYTTSSGIGTAGTFQPTYAGGSSNFIIVKFNDATGAREWATYCGIASAANICMKVAVDATGNIYAGGYTTSTTGLSFGTSEYQSISGGGMDGSVIKLDGPTGNIMWATYYGGTGAEVFTDLTIDAAGGLYAAGYAASAGLSTSGTYQQSSGGSTDGLLVKFNPATGGRLWATYFGGSGIDKILGCITDASHVYITGVTASPSGIASASGAIQGTLGGGNDAFIAQLDAATGATCPWSTYYGGSLADQGNGIAIDAGGNVIVVGTTSSTSGIASGGFQASNGGGTDAMLMKINATGSLQWASYLGNTGNETGAGLAINGNKIYIEGITSSASGIATTGQTTFGGGASDAYLVQIADAPSLSITCTVSPTTYCAGDAVNVSYTATGAFTAGNIYTAQLSDAAGSFTAPVSIGTLTAIASGTITATIPTTTTTGTGYRIRVISSTPAVTGTNNGTDMAINALPTIGAGSNVAICNGASTTLTATGGTTYTWSPAATLSASTGTSVTASPTANVTYTVTGTTSGCSNTASVTVSVNTLPNIIASAGVAICNGSSATFTATGGTSYTWSPAASLSASTGNAVDASPNTTTTYTVAGSDGTCTNTATVTLTVNPIPTIDAGAGTAICYGLSTTLIATGGTTYSWSPATGLSATTGNSVTASPLLTTTYTVTGTSLGCSGTATKTVTINPQPDAGTISGTLEVCPLGTVSLTNTATTGAWTSTNTGNATIDNTTGVVTGVATGTTVISYTVTNGCGTAAATAVVTVNPLPAAGTITGTAAVCAMATTMLSDAAGNGAWSSAAATIANVSTAGVVTGLSAGTALISYTVSNSCGIAAAITVVTVNPLSDAGNITGISITCVGSSSPLGSTVPGGTWSSANGGIAGVNGTGAITGASAGITIISYTVNSGCGAAVATRIATVNPLPATIAGVTTLCLGSSITLTDTDPLGIWSSTSGNVSVADVSGMVTGVSGGSAIITYTLPTSCATTTVVSVNQLPFPITGNTSVCPGLNITLADMTPSGTWSSGNANATVSPAGVVIGVTAGTVNISYTAPWGCSIRRIVTVNPLPSSITGNTELCASTAITLTDAGSGTWSSSSANATAGLNTGVINGVFAGTARITYTLPTSCITTTVVTIDPLPTAFTVTGGGAYCAGSNGEHIGLSNATTGINYQLYYGPSALGSPVAGTTGMAIDFGVYSTTGTYTIRAANTVTGCLNNMSGSAVISINPVLVPAVTLLSTAPNDTSCTGNAVSFTATTLNGGTIPAFQWSVNGMVNSNVTSTYSYTPANGDVIKVRLTSNAACTTPDTAIAVRGLTVLNNAMPSLTISASANPSCSGSPVTFTAIGVNGGPVPFFRWTQNDTNVATGPHYIITPNDGDTLYCLMRSTYVCRLADSVYSSNGILMSVIVSTAPVFTITATPGLSISAGQPATLSAIVAGSGAHTYQWLVNGVAVSGATSSSYSSGSFADGDMVSCVVTATDACAYSATNTVTMHVSTGVNGITAQNGSVSLSPNPSNGSFTIKGNLSAASGSEVAISVVNMLGQVVYSNSFINTGNAIDKQITLSNTLASGVYLLSIRTGSDDKIIRFVIGK